ncbi:uncharacterized protein MONOS_8119 [Monocercomonoides exilis]|uniref:uncharacterized protein n=1 Tax=Monocercomonoides exilis TaxID=2049356 RepID=UPI003559FE6D|nr:hypothetical protein MONOS_8119 [Monocercomonoides exilis]|eukprot:MONOS_8119.1-p1 / transcript=MONOS_8119.1 / gene=MONOS_8119 / organism=Monocercomonoides_exilis_PA203 / gene_product=unspecified product / transcript_product=unspecified product / location=Mono_scaffold00297:35958-37119(-) / protein_length=330 / sequence_SO=supercontig / SO=protein_coding / is_pseudo=false
MIEEYEKKGNEKNEQLLIDLCESYLFLGCSLSSESLSICISCLLKVALNQKKDEDAQIKVEMALLALSNIYLRIDAKTELYVNSIEKIIKHHQEYCNLTRLAYQSTWKFLINQFFCIRRLEDVIVNELHFAREARRELKELSNCVNWKRKEEEEGKTRIEAKEIMIIKRWLDELEAYFRSCKLWNEEFVGLLGSIVEIFREARDNHKVVSCNCIESLESITENRDVNVCCLLESGAVDVVMEELVQLNIENLRISYCLGFCSSICGRLNINKGKKKDIAEQKELKKKLFEKMEEQGYEDLIFVLCNCIVVKRTRNYFLITNFKDYFIYY